MPNNQTTNYQLSQWAKSDQVKMEDFNADNAKIDAALAALAAKVPSSHLSCHTSSYHGSGGQSKTYSFPGKPWLVLIINPNGFGTLVVRNSPYGCYLGFTSSAKASASWSNSSVYVQSGAGNINESSQDYWVFALVEN